MIRLSNKAAKKQAFADMGKEKNLINIQSLLNWYREEQKYKKENE